MTMVNGLRADLHRPRCPGMDRDGNYLGPCTCATQTATETATDEQAHTAEQAALGRIVAAAYRTAGEVLQDASEGGQTAEVASAFLALVDRLRADAAHADVVAEQLYVPEDDYDGGADDVEADTLAAGYAEQATYLRRVTGTDPSTPT